MVGSRPAGKMLTAGFLIAVAGKREDARRDVLLMLAAAAVGAAVGMLAGRKRGC